MCLGLTVQYTSRISPYCLLLKFYNRYFSVEIICYFSFSSYLKGAKVGDVLEIQSECLKKGKTLAFANVDILNKENGTLIATGRQTKYVDL